MILVLCAMPEERDALLSQMSGAAAHEGPALLYHGRALDTRYFTGTLGGKEAAVTLCGIGKTYAALTAGLMIGRLSPELVINTGCAGSLREHVHTGDVVVATRAAFWDADVPGWRRSTDSPDLSLPCEERCLRAAAALRTDFPVHTGPVVSGDSFVRRPEQLDTIRRFFPDALCAEMEGASVASAAYALSVPVCLIRAISDETLVPGHWKGIDLRLADVCARAAAVCRRVAEGLERE